MNTASKMGLGAGIAITALVLVSGLYDLGISVDGWSTMGPLGARDETPQFAVPLAEGGVVRSKELHGQPALITFWATWCGACKQEMPSIERLGVEFDGQAAVLGVNQDRRNQRRAVLQYKAERGFSFPMALDDGTVGEAFRVSVIPHTVLLDKAGQVRHVHQGRVSYERLQGELAALVAE